MTSSNMALTGRDIRKVARATVTALSRYGLESCLFGSAACALYGTQNRVPNDVDVVVLSRRDPENIKNLIILTDDRFYLVPSANRRNTYQVLWFRLCKRKECKVDILVPGRLSIPRIPLWTISDMGPFEDIPVVPFLVLLLLKLRGWTDHRVDRRRYMRDKVEVDEEDIDELLKLAVEDYEAHLDEERWLPKWFVREMRGRVQEYIEELPYSDRYWQRLGF